METETSALAPSRSAFSAFTSATTCSAMPPPYPVREASLLSTTFSDSSTFSVRWAMAGLLRLSVAPASV